MVFAEATASEKTSRQMNAEKKPGREKPIGTTVIDLRRKILPTLRGVRLAGLILLLVSAQALAQNLPPRGAYQPIPNFTGVGAGLQFREAINDRFSGAQPIAPSIASPAFANLPPEQDGMLLFCNDCKSATPCVSGGGGAFAFGQGGMWNCGGAAAAWPASLTQNLLTGGHAINGNTSSGSDQINKISVNGVQNVQDYGALGTASSTSCTANGTTSLTCSAVASTDFYVGQHVVFPHAGPTTSLSAPSGLAVTPYSYLANPGAEGQISSGASCTVGGSVTGSGTTNTSCSYHACYEVAAIDASGGQSAYSSAVCTSSAPSTVDSNNQVVASWSAVSGAAAYAVKGCYNASASCTPSSVWWEGPAGVGTYGGMYPSSSWADMGYHFGSDGVSGTGQDLETTISSITGTTVTVANALTASGSVTMQADDTPAANTAIAAVCAKGGEVVFPGQTKSGLAATYNVDFQGISTDGCNGVNLHGQSDPQVVVDYVGSIGGTVVNANYTGESHFHDFEVVGVSSPAYIFRLDSYGTMPNGANYTKRNEIDHIESGLAAGMQVAISPTTGENGEEESVHQYYQDTYGGNYIGIYIGGNGGYDTYNERLYDVLLSGNEYGIYTVGIGSLSTDNIDFELDRIDRYNNGALGAATGFYHAAHDESEGAQYYAYGIGGNASTSWQISHATLNDTLGDDGAVVYETGAVEWDNVSICESSTRQCRIQISVGGGDTFHQVDWGVALSPVGGWPGYTSYPGLLQIFCSDTAGIMRRVTGISNSIGTNLTPDFTSNNYLTVLPPTTSLTGTSGSASCSESMQGTLKIATCYLNAYEETSTAQTYTYPTAFSAAPNLLASCGTYEPSSTASTLTLPANASMTAETCNLTAIGQ